MPASSRSDCSRWPRPAPTARRSSGGRRISPGPRSPVCGCWTKIDLEEIAGYIDWTFFFSAWDLKGRFPKILDDPKVGEAARDLYQHAQTLLRQITMGKKFQARAVYGLWPAASEG